MKTNKFIGKTVGFIIFLIITLIMPGYIGISEAGINFWTTDGPEGGNVTSLVIDPATPWTLYAGTDGGVFKSFNRGANWYAINTGLTNLQVSALVVDPLNSSTIYAGTAGGVFKSINGGMFWQAINNGLTVANITTLIIDPVTTTTIYAGTKNGLFKSTNGGTNWFPAFLPNASVLALAIDPSQPSTMYAVIRGMSTGIYKSVDGGMSWSRINNIPYGIIVNTVTVDPVSPSTVYAGGPGVVFKSTDGGANWQPYSVPVVGPYVYTVKVITIDPVVPSVIYAGVDGQGIFRSADGGKTWTVNSAGQIGNYINSIAIDPLTPSIVYAGTDKGLFRSIDGGITWNAMNAGIISAIVLAVVVDPVSPSTIYAGTSKGGVYKSTDQGTSWNAINSGLANIRTDALAIDPVTPSTIYAGTFGGGIYRSGDGGASWNAVNNGLPVLYVNSIAIDPVTPSTVYAGTSQGAFKSMDSGANWQAINSGLTDQYNQLPLQPGVLAIDPLVPSTIYAGTYQGVYKSTDSGANWQAFSTGILYYAVVDELAIDPVTPSIIYAGTSAGAYKSTDGGASWQAINSGLTNLQVNALAIDPTVPATIYAGTSHGAFKSIDGGTSWQTFSSGLTNLLVKALAIDPADPSTIYAGTYGSGVFSITQGAPCALTVQISGAGSGAVKSSPSGINCGDGGNCFEIYKCNTTVSLLALPDADMIFTGWSGDSDCADGMVTMNTDKTCIANFGIQDTTPPIITVPANIAAEATGPGGAVVVYTATAFDRVDGVVVPACTPPSGTTFPMSTTVVTCSARDAAGNTSTASFTVFVWNINPDPFSFTPQVNAPLNTLLASSSITVTGINTATPIAITGGEYSVNNESFTSAPGNVNNGDSVVVRLTSSSSYFTETDAVLTIGAVSGTFSVTTLAADITPDPFLFAERADVSINTLITSNTITVTGINTATLISVSGGEYSINGSTFTSAAGLVNSGDAVRLRQLSANTATTRTDAVLTIGGVSAAFSITTKANTPPTANAGTDQTVHVGSLVTLDGSGSSDPDGNVPLAYAWSIVSRPYESAATLSDPVAVNPTLTPDLPGDYFIELVVTDSLGAASVSTYVKISTTNTAPVTDAGPDQAVTVIGSIVQLAGKSWDPDGDTITYQWSFVSMPAGSAVKLSDSNADAPTFIADVHGTYVVQLIVSDPWTQSAPATVTVSFENVKPVANAGSSQSAIVGEMVTLNGIGCTDANGDPLTYQWSFASMPAGSLSAIESPTSKVTTFVPDMPGLYVAQLIVNDGFESSDPSTIQVRVISTQSVAIDAARGMETIIAELGPTLFKNPNMPNALINKLNVMIANISDGNYSGALDQLQNDILGKTDGCAVTGAPDKNDWIITCQDQDKVYPSVVNLIQLLQRRGRQ